MKTLTWSCSVWLLMMILVPGAVGADIGVLRDGIVGTEISASAVSGDTAGPFCDTFLLVDCFAAPSILTVPGDKNLIITHFDARDDGQLLAPTFLVWGVGGPNQAVGVLDLSFFPVPDKRISPGILVTDGFVACANPLSVVSCFVSGILVDKNPRVGVNRQGVVGDLVSSARVFSTESTILYTVPTGKTLLVTYTVGDSRLFWGDESLLTSGNIDPGASIESGFIISCDGFPTPPPEFPNSCAFSGILVDNDALSLNNGETNGDSSLTDVDTDRMRRTLTTELTLSAPLGDIDLDGSLTAVDVVVLRRILAGRYVAT